MWPRSFSFRRIELTQALSRFLGKQPVKINLLDAVGLASRFYDRKYFDVPMVIARDRSPVVAEFALRLQRVGRGVNHQVVVLRNLLQATQRAAKQACEMPPILSGRGRFELVVVRPRHQPDFVRHAGCIRAESEIVADGVHDAFLLPHFLAEDVAKHAAFAVAKPFARGAQLVEDAARNKRSCGHLGMRVGPLLSRLRTLILEYGYIFEAGVPLKVRDARGVGFEHSFDLLVRHLREVSRMIGRLYDDLVSASRVHAIVDSFRRARRVAFDVIKRPEVWIGANLPGALWRKVEEDLGLQAVF